MTVWGEAVEDGAVGDVGGARDGEDEALGAGLLDVLVDGVVGDGWEEVADLFVGGVAAAADDEEDADVNHVAAEVLFVEGVEDGDEGRHGELRVTNYELRITNYELAKLIRGVVIGGCHAR